MSRILAGAAAAAVLALAVSSVEAQPYGIPAPRQPNTTVIINNLPPDPGGFTTQPFFSSLLFNNAIQATSARDGTNRVFVVDQSGLISSFDADLATPTVSTFLNVTSTVTFGGERGLLCLAFHPQYSSNGKFYLYYTAASPTGNLTLAEYINNNPSGNPTVTPTGRVLLSIPHSRTNHNGGTAMFGEDGFLYLSTGDSGGANDPDNAAQNMASMLGKMLRIDVDARPFDSGKQYVVPASNPFLFATGGTGTNTYVESRQAGGALTTPAQGYNEISGTFANSTLKSTASGLTGTGSRASTASTGTYTFRFTPTLPADGLYNVYVTVPNNAAAAATNVTYRIVYRDGLATWPSLALTQSNAGGAWRLLRRNLPMLAGSGASIEFTVNNPSAGSLFADAVRFERVASVQPEIYALGLRNPWRCSVDRVAGDIWIGDVGQDNREEVSILRSGGNFGWRDREGDLCTPTVSGAICDNSGMVEPVYVYAHSGPAPTGCSITGGIVYRGSATPTLYGTYLFADYCSGWIRGIRWDGSNLTFNAQLATTGFNVTSFGETENGNLLFCRAGSGQPLYTLVPSSTPPPSDVPLKLSDNPSLLQLGLGNQVTGVIPYEPQVQFWTDGSIKQRYIAMPNLAQLTYQAGTSYDVPNSTTLIKNYLLPLTDGNPATAVRVETRLLIKDTAGTWRGFSYRWNDSQTDAFLLTGSDTRNFTIQTSGGPLAYTWQFPSSTQCLQCHTTAANRALGVSTLQLNSNFAYPTSGVTDNQLRTLNHLSCFTPPGLPGGEPGIASLPSMPKVGNTGAPLAQRAKAYLEANCANCHQPGGPTGVVMDLRYLTDSSAMSVINVDPVRGDLGVAGAKLVKPGDPDASVLYLRMNTLNANHRMPPLSSTRIDPEGTQVIRDWILSLSTPSSLGATGWQLY